ncbi:YbaN family protein [Parasphingorhabdus sp.]|uniref:YbaN family protein n=1 Tax=Parasphingorhabdus sp. TaxID=2709688 RepID=UPI003263415C
MTRHLYLLAGFTALALGSVGVILPLLPTVPFVILAAFCFARSSPKLEAWLLDHHVFGPHILNWRHKRAISKKGKRAALVAFAASAIIGLVFVDLPWNLAPITAAIIGGTWIWTRNEPSVPLPDTPDVPLDPSQKE